MCAACGLGPVCHFAAAGAVLQIVLGLASPRERIRMLRTKCALPFVAAMVSPERDGIVQHFISRAAEDAEFFSASVTGAVCVAVRELGLPWPPPLDGRVPGFAGAERDDPEAGA